MRTTPLALCITAILAALSSCQHREHEPIVEKRLVPNPLLADECEKNPYGSLFLAERVNDTYVENVGMVATYRFAARRFPTESKYILGCRTLGTPIKPVAWYDVDDDGQLGRQIDQGTLMLDNEMFLMFDFCRGEPVEYWLCSQDGKARLGHTFVPYPIQADGRDGAQVSIRRLTPDARLVLLEGKDFNPDEKIIVSSQSGSKRTANLPLTCTNGRFSVLLETPEPERSGGCSYVDVLRVGERLSLEYDWGCEAVNPKKRLGNTSRIRPDALLKLPTDINK